MNDMHFHCVRCKKDQWLPEDQIHCSYCGSMSLWEIVEDDEPELETAERRLNFRTNEFGERIPHMLSVAPVDSYEVTDSILDAMAVLR